MVCLYLETKKKINKATKINLENCLAKEYFKFGCYHLPLQKYLKKKQTNSLRPSKQKMK